MINMIKGRVQRMFRRREVYERRCPACNSPITVILIGKLFRPNIVAEVAFHGELQGCRRGRSER